MKLLNQYKNVQFLGLYNGQMSLWYPDRLEVGEFSIPTEKGDDYVIWSKTNKFLSRKRNSVEMVFQKDGFEKWPQGRFGDVNKINDCVYTYKYEGGIYSLSFFCDGEENLVNIESDRPLSVYNIGVSSLHDVLILSRTPMFNCKSLLFYSKTGKLLWKFFGEDDCLKINGFCLPIVDNVVVIISQKIVATKKIQGFDIHTGEKLWEVNVECGYPNTFFAGEDKMLYGCMSTWNKGYVSSKIQMCKLNPFTGAVEISVLKEDEKYEVYPWQVSMYGRRLYYADNRSGCEIGVIDIDKKELLDCTPLKLKRGYTIDAPVVTDDKVYQFIREMRELRVYENVPI